MSSYSYSKEINQMYAAIKNGKKRHLKWQIHFL